MHNRIVNVTLKEVKSEAMRVCPYTLWQASFFVSFANIDINLSFVTPPPYFQSNLREDTQSSTFAETLLFTTHVFISCRSVDYCITFL